MKKQVTWVSFYKGRRLLLCIKSRPREVIFCKHHMWKFPSDSGNSPSPTHTCPHKSFHHHHTQVQAHLCIPCNRDHHLWQGWLSCFCSSRHPTDISTHIRFRRCHKQGCAERDKCHCSLLTPSECLWENNGFQKWSIQVLVITDNPPLDSLKENKCNLFYIPLFLHSPLCCKDHCGQFPHPSPPCSCLPPTNTWIHKSYHFCHKQAHTLGANSMNLKNFQIGFSSWTLIKSLYHFEKWQW